MKHTSIHIQKTVSQMLHGMFKQPIRLECGYLLTYVI